MTSFEQWSAAAGTPEGDFYPLLVPETECAEPEIRHWDVRVIVWELFSEPRMVALREGGVEVVEASSGQEEPLPSALQANRRGGEGVVSVDLRLLRNVAEIRRLKKEHPELERWVLSTFGEVPFDPEQLVGETLRQLTGVMAGCDVIEIRQAEGEEFQSVWARLNVARLMREESGLQDAPDPVTGAGLFRELEVKLSSGAQVAEPL